jgi:hypothetical protein
MEALSKPGAGIRGITSKQIWPRQKSTICGDGSGTQAGSSSVASKAAAARGRRWKAQGRGIIKVWLASTEVRLTVNRVSCRKALMKPPKAWRRRHLTAFAILNQAPFHSSRNRISAGRKINKQIGEHEGMIEQLRQCRLCLGFLATQNFGINEANSAGRHFM